MTDLAQPIVNKTAGNHELRTSSSSLLPLSGPDPVSIYVSMLADRSSALFSRHPTGPFFQDGMCWQSGPTYGLSITYLLQEGVEELLPFGPDPKLWFSPVVRINDQRTQLGFVPPVPSPPQGYLFAVRVAGGNLLEIIDPQIVVTPIPGDGHGEDRVGTA